MPDHPRYTVDYPAQVVDVDDTDLLQNARAALRYNVWSPLAQAVLTEVVERFGREVEAVDATPCTAEKWSWDLFRAEQVDPYWMRCHLLGPHDEHENSETGAKWKADE